MAPLFQPPETFVGVPAGPPGPGCRAAILGLPFDCGTHPFHVGSRQGPTEVRRQSRLLRRFHPSLADRDVLAAMAVVDCGNVVLTPGRIDDAFPRIEAAALSVLHAGAVPVGIGGDGSVSLPLMRAAARRHPGLIVAAHRQPHRRLSLHARRSLQRGHPVHPRGRGGRGRRVSSWHVGVRGFTYCAGVLAYAAALGYRVVTLDELLRRGFAQAIAEFRDAALGRPVYLCWDMDVFDPSVAPGVATPTWGGLSAREGIELIRTLGGLNIVAADFNTVSPPHDVQGMAAHLCAHMIMEAMLLLAAQ